MNTQCRICLTSATDCLYFNILNKLNEEATILDGIGSIANIQILQGDHLPQFICDQCNLKLGQCCLFRNLIIKSNSELNKQLAQVDNNIGNQEIINRGDENKDLKKPLKLENNVDTQSVASNDSIHDNKMEERSSNIDPLRDINCPKGKEKKTGKSSISNRIHKCSECGLNFKQANHLKVHIAYLHLEKQFQCDICNKKFARKYDLIYHQRVHTGEKPFTCELCGKSFASSSYFYIHQRMHAGQKKLKCNICQNRFMNSYQLEIHIRQKHTLERPFLCELCSHCFSSSSALFRHKRDVHDEKAVCSICNKLYSKRVLKDHMKRHKERDEGIKRFSCEICGKRFTCATSKKRHLVVHSGEKAYKCEVCEKAFNQKSTLQTHMRVHSQIMPFNCDFCSKSFRYKHHLKLHCEKHHKGEDCENYELTEVKS